MGQLIVGVVPEMLGLVATPAAVVACVLLLDTSHALRNVALFAGAFLLPYAALSAVVVAVGGAHGAREGAGEARAWVSLGVGVLFLVGGVISRFRRRAAGSGGTPGWVRTLTQPSPGGLVLTGLALSVLNPNVAILLAGLNSVLALADGPGQRVAGVLLLLGSALLDFVVPGLVYALLGHRGEVWLRTAKGWLVAHNQTILVAVLLFFGVVFVVRGLVNLL